jgi:hypothetical protein
MNKIKTCVPYLVLVILSIPFIACKNNSSGDNVADVVVRNDKNALQIAQIHQNQALWL